MILNNKTKRLLIYFVGLFILALGLTLNTKANLGVSPIISVPYSISQITGLNFGDLTFIEYVGFVFIQIWIHISEKNKKRILSDLLQLLSIPRWRSHPIHENRATESIWTEPCNPLLRATKSTKRATSA